EMQSIFNQVVEDAPLAPFQLNNRTFKPSTSHKRIRTLQDLKEREGKSAGVNRENTEYEKLMKLLVELTEEKEKKQQELKQKEIERKYQRKQKKQREKKEKERRKREEKERRKREEKERRKREERERRERERRERQNIGSNDPLSSERQSALDDRHNTTLTSYMVTSIAMLIGLMPVIYQKTNKKSPDYLGKSKGQAEEKAR
ncbi:MAG: hypothetical protein AAF335_04320, partial [Bacteroidota bacterium]